MHAKRPVCVMTDVHTLYLHFLLEKEIFECTLVWHLFFCSIWNVP